jgi:tetratricopeptide (TPR) repeat protein
MPLALAAVAFPVAGQDGVSLADSRVCAGALNAVAAATAELVRSLETASASNQPARAAFLRGCQLFAEDKPDKADDEFEKAVKLEEGNAVYHFWLGRAVGAQAQDANPLRQPGLARRTRSEFERAVAIAPDYLDAREGLIEYYLAAPAILGGSKDKALMEVSQILRRDRYRGGMAAVKVALESNDTTTAMRAYQDLTTQYPDSVGPYSSLAVMYMTQKRWPDAWKAVDQMNTMRPSWQPARYAIGRTAAESGERLAEGEAALRGYLAHQPGPGEPSLAAAHWRLGMILEKRGDRAGARAEYEIAAKLDPSLPGPKAGLGRVK